MILIRPIPKTDQSATPQDRAKSEGRAPDEPDLPGCATACGVDRPGRVVCVTFWLLFQLNSAGRGLRRQCRHSSGNAENQLAYARNRSARSPWRSLAMTSRSI